jgi:hypothetical protein
MKLEAKCASETSVYRTTRHYIQEDRTPKRSLCSNPKSNIFIIYFPSSIAQSVHHHIIELLMNNELQNIWKGAVMLQFQVLSRNLPGSTAEDTVKIACVPSEIRIHYIQKRSCFSQLVRYSILKKVPVSVSVVPSVSRQRLALSIESN